jgi:hypothetical protein
VLLFFPFGWTGTCARSIAERFGSGDGERKTLLTRQIAFEPLPASVLFGFRFMWDFDQLSVPCPNDRFISW